jgi:diguanylate cyclase (GGDEF)-like protein
MTLNEIPLVVALFALPPTYVVAVRVAGAVLPVLIRDRRSLRKACFTLAHYALEGAVVVTVFHLALGGHEPLSARGWLALVLAIVAGDTLGMLLISLAIAATTGALPHVDSDLVGLGPIPALVNTSFALVVVYVVSVDWRAVWTLAVLAAALVVARRAQEALRRRTATLEQLTRFTSEIGGLLDVDSAATAAGTTIARTLGAELVEITLAADFAGRDRRWEGRYDGTSSEPDGVARAAVLRSWLGDSGLLAKRGTNDQPLAVALHDAELQDALAVPLQGDEGVIGALLVGDKVGGVETFEPADLRTVQALANHLAVVLQNARRADVITEQAVETLRRSLLDSLTGLPNRRGLEESLLEVVEGGDPDITHSLVLLNLDRFKEINDTLGYPAGDALLTMVGTRLARTAPDSAMLARVGGDEFAVLLPSTDPVRAEAVVALLRHSLAAPFDLDDLMVTIGASFGLAAVPGGTAVIDVVRRADIAMSGAKERRTGLETYRPDLDASSRERLTLLTDLRRAVTDGSLTVFVQPKVNIRDGRVAGVEALARWTHPDRGIIPPDAFIPVAEHSGLVTPLTMTVLRQTLHALEGWRRAGWELSAAVNISPRSLLELDFVEEVARALAAVEVPASAVTFEITESSLMSDPERAIAALQRLRDLGVKLSIDDLGTGYSSLAYLQRLPVDEIKIDKSFLLRADLDAGDESVAIIGAMVDLGHRLGRAVVAEGVEDETAWRTLQALGCDLAQGYWMSRPLPMPDLLGWLESWRPTAVASLRAVR